MASSESSLGIPGHWQRSTSSSTPKTKDKIPVGSRAAVGRCSIAEVSLEDVRGEAAVPNAHAKLTAYPTPVTDAPKKRPRRKCAGVIVMSGLCTESIRQDGYIARAPNTTPLVSSTTALRCRKKRNWFSLI